METPICFWPNRIGFHIGKGCTRELPSFNAQVSESNIPTPLS